MTRIEIASMRHQRHDNVLPPEPPSGPTTSIDVVKRSIVQAAAVIGALCVTMYAAVELLRH
ncbi:hypothetical protein ABZV80_37290 [Streptomyces sp. NPDC005132]|uniref:hypothetical protein n=1 Tax=Streptomyces sp. NPDC005132 TaxID=3154294 RepID=UPI0033BA3381